MTDESKEGGGSQKEPPRPKNVSNIKPVQIMKGWLDSAGVPDSAHLAVTLHNDVMDIMNSEGDSGDKAPKNSRPQKPLPFRRKK